MPTFKTRTFYAALVHAIQTGIEFCKDKTDQEPKHLRTGLNTVMCDHASLARLLIRKGLITEEEYEEALLDGLRAEVDEYRKRIAQERGVDVDVIHLA